MNEARVRMLAAGRQVELTKKMLKKFSRDQIDITQIISTLETSELKAENVLAYPDYNYAMGIPSKQREFDVIITQNADGRAIRIVGFLHRQKKARKK